MTTPNEPENPPAFPTPGKLVDNGIRGPGFREWTESSAIPGMSLRDYFAAKASESDIKAHTSINGGRNIRSRERAKFAYADAMLKARAVK